MRACPSCGQLLPPEAFYCSKRKNACIICTKKRNAIWWDAKRTAVSAARKRQRDRERYAANKETMKEAARKRRAMWRATRPRKPHGRWNKLPDDEARSRQLDRYRKRNQRILATPAGKIRLAVSRRINGLLRGSRKTSKTLVENLGYSISDLCRHLERQFTKGMSWSNYGPSGWHIDHIIPASKFSVREIGDAEFKACWELSNLRPLWASDNLKKKNKRTHLL